MLKTVGLKRNSNVRTIHPEQWNSNSKMGLQPPTLPIISPMSSRKQTKFHARSKSRNYMLTT